jgi:hypothetical protein
MKKTPLIFAVLLPMLLYGQDDIPVVASGTLETDDYQWSFTMGDLAILTLQTADYCWTQGSQQPQLNSVGTQQPVLPDATMTLFPNPTEGVLFCTVAMPSDNVPLRADMFDAAGRYVALNLPVVRSNEKSRLVLTSLPAGSYFLAVSDVEGRRIVKQFQKI